MINADKFIEEQAERVQFGEVVIVAKIRSGLVYRVEKTISFAENIQPRRGPRMANSSECLNCNVPPPAYREYVKALETANISHIDRIKLTVAKNKIRMCESWWRASILYWQKTQPVTYGWRFKNLPDNLQGTRLTIRGAYLQIELHNILNRWPNIEVLNLYRRIIGFLIDHGIIESSIDEVVLVTSVTEIEVRWDFLKSHWFDGLRFWKVSDCKGTLYFTKETARTRFRFYEKAEHVRFEAIFRRRDIDRIRGTPKEIIQGVEP